MDLLLKRSILVALCVGALPVAPQAFGMKRGMKMKRQEQSNDFVVANKEYRAFAQETYDCLTKALGDEFERKHGKGSRKKIDDDIQEQDKLAVYFVHEHCEQPPRGICIPDSVVGEKEAWQSAIRAMVANTWLGSPYGDDMDKQGLFEACDALLVCKDNAREVCAEFLWKMEESLRARSVGDQDQASCLLLGYLNRCSKMKNSSFYANIIKELDVLIASCNQVRGDEGMFAKGQNLASIKSLIERWSPVESLKKAYAQLQELVPYENSSTIISSEVLQAQEGRARKFYKLLSGCYGKNFSQETIFMPRALDRKEIDAKVEKDGALRFLYSNKGNSGMESFNDRIVVDFSTFPEELLQDENSFSYAHFDCALRESVARAWLGQHWLTLEPEQEGFEAASLAALLDFSYKNSAKNLVVCNYYTDENMRRLNNGILGLINGIANKGKDKVDKVILELESVKRELAENPGILKKEPLIAHLMGTKNMDLHVHMIIFLLKNWKHVVTFKEAYEQESSLLSKLKGL